MRFGFSEPGWGMVGGLGRSVFADESCRAANTLLRPRAGQARPTRFLEPVIICSFLGRDWLETQA